MNLKLSEVDQLYKELYGVVSGNTNVFKGILSQKVSFKLKFRLKTRLGKKVTEIMEMVEEKKKELALSFGAVEEHNSWKFPSVSKKEGIEPEKVKAFEGEFLSWLNDEKNKVSLLEEGKPKETIMMDLSLFVDEDGKPLFFEETYHLLMDKFVTEDAA